MTDQDKRETAEELRKLADKLSDGWYDNIGVDASDLILLLKAADLLCPTETKSDGG